MGVRERLVLLALRQFRACLVVRILNQLICFRGHCAIESISNHIKSRRWLVLLREVGHKDVAVSSRNELSSKARISWMSHAPSVA